MTVRPADAGGEGGGGGLPAVWRESAVLGDKAAGACGGKGCPGEIASVVKMGQNAVLGVVTVLISLYWLTYEESADKGLEGRGSEGSEVAGKEIGMRNLDSLAVHGDVGVGEAGGAELMNPIGCYQGVL